MDMSVVHKGALAKAYKHIVVPLFIISVIAFIDRVNIGYAAMTMNKDLGFSPEIFGMGAGIFFIGYVLFEIPGALLAEKFSPRMWIARIMVSWGIVSGLMAFMTTEWQFFVIRFLLGACEASLYPVIYASIVPRFFVPDDRPKALAIFLTSMQISAVIGGPLAGWLLNVPMFGLKGWQGLFLIEAVPAVLFGVGGYFWLKDRPRDCQWMTRDEQEFLEEAYEREVSAKSQIKKYTVLQALGDKEVLKLCALYFFWITGFWGFNFWMPQVLKSLSGWSTQMVGFMSVIPFAISLVTMIWIGASSSRTGEKKWHGAIPLFIAAIGFGLGTLTKDPLISFILIIISAIGVYGPFGVWWSYPSTFLSGAAAAGAAALINSAGNIGGFVGPYVLGWVKSTTGSFTAAWLYLTLSLVIAGCMMLTLKKKNPTERNRG